jgi:hypothetical protein
VRLALIAAALVAAVRVAAADPHHVLVLHAEGTADAGARGKVDVQVLKLAKNIEGTVEAGDITYTDATVAAGCSETEPKCRDEVLTTLGVDEIVATTVNAGAGGELTVTVRRFAKGSAPKQAVASVASGQPPDTAMNTAVGPMFGVTTAPTPTPEPTPSPEPKPVEPAPVTLAPAAPTPAAQPATVTAAPDNRIVDSTDDGAGTRKLAVGGIVTGGALVVLGIVMWAEASSTQSDIDNAPAPKTIKDIQNLMDLESTGDTYATVGNVAFIGGLAVAAASGFVYWREHRHHDGAQHAHLVPTVLDHGAGVALRFGGLP